MKTLSLVLICILASTAHAQVVTIEKKLECAPREAVLKSVLIEHGHIPVWTGVQGRFDFVLTENKKTGEWTMIQFDDTIACLLAEGVKARPVFIGMHAS